MLLRTETALTCVQIRRRRLEIYFSITGSNISACIVLIFSNPIYLTLHEGNSICAIEL
jgi:hypothetical protein